MTVANTSKTMLNSNGESGHPCLVPDFRGNDFNFSPLKIMFAVGLSYMALIMLRHVLSMPAFWRLFFFFFIINGCWILSKAFSASIEIVIWFLSFNLLMWCITLFDLQILKNPCIPGIKPTWSWCMIQPGYFRKPLGIQPIMTLAQFRIMRSSSMPCIHGLMFGQDSSPL